MARPSIALAWLLACANAPAAGQILVDGPGVYTHSGDHTIGPNGTQTRLDNSIYAPDGIYNRTGHWLFGPHGSSASSDGAVFGSGGSTARQVGKTTFINGPNGDLACRSMGRHLICN